MPPSSPQPTRIVAVDIGGANLKFADCSAKSLVSSKSLVSAKSSVSRKCQVSGKTWSLPFEMWRRVAELEAVLRDQIGDCDRLLVTMTGELADCFADRASGVQAIADAVVAVKPAAEFFAVDGQFASCAALRTDPMRFAASNWVATALAWAARVETPSLVIDIGSTTTDLIPISAGRIDTDDRTDRDRLAAGTLVYVGAARTPVCGLVETLLDRDTVVPVMKEWFATIDDARLLLRFAAEDEANCDTANHRPRTIHEAAIRILRMIGTDLNDRSIEDAVALAAQIHTAACNRIENAISPFSERSVIVASEHRDLIPATIAYHQVAAGEPIDPCTAMLHLASTIAVPTDG